jgi:hypothetical protein
MFDQVGSDVAELTDDAVLSGLRELVAVRRAVDSREARLLAEADARGLCDRQFGLTTTHWHAREGGLSIDAARSRVKVATKLRRLLPATDAALASGDISWDQARVIADAANPRIEEQIADIEDALLLQQTESASIAGGGRLRGSRRSSIRTVDMIRPTTSSRTGCTSVGARPAPISRARWSASLR